MVPDLEPVASNQFDRKAAEGTRLTATDVLLSLATSPFVNPLTAAASC